MPRRPTILALMLLLLGTACGGGGHASASTGSLEHAASTRPLTTEDSTAAKIASLVRVSGQAVLDNPVCACAGSAHTMAILPTVTNETNRTIEAFKGSFTVTLTDVFGKRTDVPVQASWDIADGKSPLPPRTTLVDRGRYLSTEEDYITASDTSYGDAWFYDLNEFIPDQDALLKYLTASCAIVCNRPSPVKRFTISVTFTGTELVFQDGSRIGSP